MPSLSVIVPTMGRPSLADTLASIAPGLEDDDQLVVVADGEGDRDAAYGAWKSFMLPDRPGQWCFNIGRDVPSSYGNHQRDVGMRVARTDWLLFIDDDDEYVPGALTTVRRSVEARPGVPHIFRMSFGGGHHAHGVTLWQREQVMASNIGTPMVVLPNRPYETSWMKHDQSGIRGWTSDFGFLAEAIAEAGEPVWHRQVIAMIRPRPGYREVMQAGADREGSAPRNC